MKKAIVILTCLFLFGNFSANAQWSSIKKAAKKVGSTTKKYTTTGGKKVWGATKKVGSTTKKYTVIGGKKTWGATKKVGSTSKKYTVIGGKKVWGASKKVGSTAKKYTVKGGKLVFEGGKVLGGVVMGAGGTILVQAYGISKSVIVDGRIPRYRRVTQREYDFANKKLFDGRLPDRSKILVSNLLGYGDRPFVWPMGTGHILMNLGGPAYNDGLKDEGLFIHEMTHVWQLHVSADVKWTLKGIYNQVKNSATDANVYNVNCNKTWGSMNLEQQATVAETCFNQRKQGIFGQCYENKVVEHIRKGNGFD